MFDIYVLSEMAESPMISAGVEAGWIKVWEHGLDAFPKNNPEKALVFRGITKRKEIGHCWKNNIPFFYIDTGYLGNYFNYKGYHRLALNNLQSTNLPNKNVKFSFQRFLDTGETLLEPRLNQRTYILLCPPSLKSGLFYNIDVEKWKQETIDKIKKYTPLEIRIRQKPASVTERAIGNPFRHEALKAHAVVTYNSIVATESIICGIPAFTMAPNAANSVTCNDLSKIDSPPFPNDTLRRMWAASLAGHQFTKEEFLNGYTINCIQGYYSVTV